jgi:hypothetical protein
MRRFLGCSVLALSLFTAAGCGSSKPAVHLGGPTHPRWLTAIVKREVRQLGNHPVQRTTYRRSPGRGGEEIVEVFGRFATPPPSCPPGARCPLMISMRGTVLRLVISTRTHRLVSMQITQPVTPARAPQTARAASSVYAIFPSEPGSRACRIPAGGVRPSGTPGIPAQCTTQLVGARPGFARIRFAERWSMDHRGQTAAWIMSVRLRDGRITGEHVTGQPPQYWK